MGSYNLSCAATGLPIKANDELVCIFTTTDSQGCLAILALAKKV